MSYCVRTIKRNYNPNASVHSQVPINDNTFLSVKIAGKANIIKSTVFCLPSTVYDLTKRLLLKSTVIFFCSTRVRVVFDPVNV